MFWQALQEGRLHGGTSTTLKSYILGSVTLNSYIYHPTVKSELQGVILI